MLSLVVCAMNTSVIAHKDDPANIGPDLCMGGVDFFVQRS
jgi:hypothetical protein